jgi:hypothetical protein
VSDIIKRVRKLRWIGMEDEAERVLIAARRAQPADIVFAEPSDTD